MTRGLWFAIATSFLAGLSWSQAIPVINSFASSAAVTNPGLVTNLSWSVANATTISVDQSVGDVTGQNSIYVGPVQTTTYTLTASAGSNAVTKQVTVTVVDTPAPVFGSGKTYYVSPAGSDSNSGLSAGSAWQTIAKVNGTNLQPGDTVLFQRGGEWHESLTAPTSGAAGNSISFADYGTGAKPKFWGSNVLNNSLFVPAGNGLYTYSIASTVSAALVNHTFFYTSSTNNAADLVNSWSYSGTTLTINSPNSDPRVNGNIYTAVVRQDIIFSNYKNHLVFRNLVADESAQINQGYAIRIQNSTDVLVDSCEAYRAGKHHIASINSTQFVGKNLYAAWAMPGQSRIGATGDDPAATAYVSYGDSSVSLPNQTSEWRNCVWDHPVDPQNPINYYAFYTHGSNVTSVLLDNMSSLGANLTVYNGDNLSARISVKGGLIQNARLAAYGQNILVDGTHITGPNGSVLMGGINSTFQNMLLEGSYLEADGYQSAAVSQASGNTLRFSTIVLDSRAAASYACVTLDSNFSGTSSQGAHFQYYGNICTAPTALKQWDFYPVSADLAQAQYNLYASNVAFAQAASGGGFNYLTFGQWQTDGLDTKSLQGDPVFVDAGHSNYNLSQGSPAIDAAALPVSLLTANPPIPTDQADNPRLEGKAFDIGALESSGPPSLPGWSMSAAGGTPQSTTVGTSFAAALQAKVIDSGGNPVVGITVTFTLPASAASATFSGSTTATVMTDANGVATSPAAGANGQPGNYTVMATALDVATPASFSLTNNAIVMGGVLSGSGNSAATLANLTTEGSADWVQWGEASLNRKAGVTAQIGAYTLIGSGGVSTYNNDPRPLNWTDGAPTATGTNNKDGMYTSGAGKGFSVTVPADPNARQLIVHVGGWFSSGTLTAHLSDGSAPDFVDTTVAVNGQYDRNYSLFYSTPSGGRTLTVSWVMASGSGNVTLNALALAGTAPAPVPTSITATGGTPQSAIINAAFGATLQATVRDASNNPVSGVAVTFSVPASGASAVFSGTASVMTNTSGVATSPNLTANGQTGSFLATGSAAGITTSASFNLTNSPAAAAGTLSGSGTSVITAVNLTTEGSTDWVHWGDSALNRKTGVTAQIGNYTIVGSGNVQSYNNDPRPVSWTDGAPTANATNNKNGIYVSGAGSGFSFTTPADSSVRQLVVHVAGWFSGGTLTAHLSDGSASDFVDTTTVVNSQYDRNYTLVYTAPAAGRTLTVKWVMASGTGNVTLNAAALAP